MNNTVDEIKSLLVSNYEEELRTKGEVTKEFFDSIKLPLGHEEIVLPTLTRCIPRHPPKKSAANISGQKSATLRL